jgi:hypothetical protein
MPSRNIIYNILTMINDRYRSYDMNKYYVVALQGRGSSSERLLARKGSDSYDVERRFIPKTSFEGYNRYWEVITFETVTEAQKIASAINAALDSISREAVVIEYIQVPEPTSDQV